MAARRFLSLLIVLELALAGAAGAQTVEVYDRNNQLVDLASSPAFALRSRPVLFVHGHNLLFSNDFNRNYEKNWIDTIQGHTSFEDTLQLQENLWLDIEPYFIRFVDQKRSITDDAAEIALAVDGILARHDQAAGTTSATLAIIAYSKGTISSRYYLKNLASGPNRVTEFVAIAPPNHGLDSDLSSANEDDNTALKQLNNGYDEDGDPFPNNNTQSLDFIQTLNGHPIVDSAPPATTKYDSEAPGSRHPLAPFSDGTLYVCLYAAGNTDFVGGDLPQADGRRLASNMATHAVNVPLPVTGGSELFVHRNTVHTPAVICAALYAVAHHRAPHPDMEFEAPGGVPLVPPRTAVKLVLDVSGSMARTTPNGSTRIEVLRDAVHLFADLWLAVASAPERLGVTYFGTAASSFDVGGEVLFEVTAPNATALKDHVDGQMNVASNLTAMGLGLEDAIDALEAQYVEWIPFREIVLLTDGMQNVAPLVTGSPPQVGTKALDSTLGIRIHTIEVGGQNTVMQLLAGIAQATGGTQAVTHEPDDDLNQLFVDALVTALEQNSPQLLAYRRGNLAGNTAEESFRVNGGTRRLVLELSWRGGAALTYAVERDGQDVTHLGAFIQGAFYRIFYVDSPEEGEWTMRIHGDGNTAYEAAAIVDEPNLRYDLTLARPVVRAGEPLELTLSLGRPGASVSAIVGAPGESVANLLSTHAFPRGAEDLQLEGGTAADKKLHALLRDELLRKRLRPSGRTVPAKDNGDGTYSLTFADATVPGPHRVTVAFESGAHHRTTSTTALVTLGEVTDAGLRLDGDVLRLRPRDRFGNYLGPDSGHRIDVSPAAGSPVDGQDGSYTVPLPPGTDRVRVRIAGDEVFDGPTSELGGGPAVWWWLVLVAAVVAFVVLFRRLRR